LLFFTLKDFHAELVSWSFSLFHSWKDLWNFVFDYVQHHLLFGLNFCDVLIFPPLTGFFSLCTGRNVEGQGWGRSGLGSMVMFVV
jgi:hypothetical protein